MKNSTCRSQTDVSRHQSSQSGRRREFDLRTYLLEFGSRSGDLVERIQQTRRRLATNADGCPLADEYEQFDIEVKEALFSTRRGKPYRLIFTIVGDEVRILRVRGPGQSAVDPSDI